MHTSRQKRRRKNEYESNTDPRTLPTDTDTDTGELKQGGKKRFNQSWNKNKTMLKME